MFVGLTSAGYPPPWCPKCGADLKGAPTSPPPAQHQSGHRARNEPVEVVQPVDEDPDPYAPVPPVPVVSVRAVTEPPRMPERQPTYADSNDPYAAYTPEAVAEEAAWRKSCKEVAGVLFGMAGLQLLIGVGVATVLGPFIEALPYVGKGMAPIIAAVMIFLSFVYAVLGWWALRQPLTPAVIGLLIYAGDSILLLILMIQYKQMNYITVMIRIAIISAFVKAVTTATNARQPRPRYRRDW